MAKIDNRPKEKMQLTIEFADNGIILRNHELEDDVTLALTTETTSTSLARVCDFDHSEEYRVIGKKIYDWLSGEMADYTGHLDYYGAKLDITATLNVRFR